jgi:hypothetical protein
MNQALFAHMNNKRKMKKKKGWVHSQRNKVTLLSLLLNNGPSQVKSKDFRSYTVFIPHRDVKLKIQDG